MRQLIEKFNGEENQFGNSFIDLKKAYDKVPREVLLSFEEKRIPRNINS